MGYVQVRNVGKRYRIYASPWDRLREALSPHGAQRHQERWALRDVTFGVEPGESVAVIGVNGAGKSTLLKIITGTTKPTTGTVELGGRVAALLELGMGFAPDFTGRENAIMAGQLLGFTTAEIASRLPEIEDFAAIGDYIDRPMRTYSSGMQVRLAFSVATAVRPDILIVDEALSVGDVFFQQKCAERIRGFKSAGTTLLFVSHDMAAVHNLCDRAVLLRDGRVALDASPREVVDLYQATVLRRQDERPQSLAVVEAPADAAAVGSIATGSVRVLDVRLLDARGNRTDCLPSDETCALAVDLHFLADVEDPHVGFKIRDRLGRVLFETNTYGMRAPIGRVAAGTHLCVRFAFANTLYWGDYTITVGVADGGYGEASFRQVLAYVHDLCPFTVVRNMGSIVWAGVANLNPRVEVSRAHA